MQGHAAVAAMLLENGADASARSEDLGTPLAAASARGHVDVVRAILDRAPDRDRDHIGIDESLVNSASKGHEQIVNILLSNGGSPNATSKDGVAALFWASYNGHPEVV
jgi:ankyrin repeat protein